ncbi:hypothetical protein GCM10017596_10800 [Microbacterium keratanolyticum]|uniref:Uncharacterized protein n=1 Tax=Microbacterium keratanolyticum TaxID=67574 RepID=A0A9W6HSS2_9MICO|nr:hypothetical protein GCM10017596_10800 [Microbacterium keratanolyticum]
MQRTASDELALRLRDDEFLHRPVEHREVFTQQDALLDHRRKERADAFDVCAAGWPHDDLAHMTSLERPPCAHLREKRIHCRVSRRNAP